MSFHVEVYALVRRIPPGQVMTYGQIATVVGRARAARAVGGAMRHCPDGVPWHRVVNAQGAISRRRQGSGMLTQRIRLEQEGIHLRRGRVWLARYQWEPSTPGAGRARSSRIGAIVNGPIGSPSSPDVRGSKRSSRSPRKAGSVKRSSRPARSAGSSKRSSRPAGSAGSSKRSSRPAQMGGRWGGRNGPPISRGSSVCDWR